MKKKKKIKCWVPIHTSAEFDIDKPDNWGEMNEKEKIYHFTSIMTQVGGLCHQCANHIDTDFEVSQDWPDKYVEFFEE